MSLTLPIEVDKLVTWALVGLLGLCVKWVRDQNRLRREIRAQHKQIRAAYDVCRRLLHQFSHGPDYSELQAIRHKIAILSDAMWVEEGHTDYRRAVDERGRKIPITPELVARLLGDDPEKKP